MSESKRYAAVQQQLKILLDQAAQPLPSDAYGIVNLGRAILCAEVYVRNEQTKARADHARSEILGWLQHRIRSL
jgi:hypothetical protein